MVETPTTADCRGWCLHQPPTNLNAPQTKADIDLQLKLQRPAPAFGNALLAAVHISVFNSS